MSGPWFLGVDGGGTSTVVLLADADGKVAGRGAAGPSNAKAVGPDRAREALRSAIEEARREAGIGPGPVAAACLGLAGFDRPIDRAVLTDWSESEGWADRLVLVNDGDLVIAAGTPEGWGIGLIAGTGSICVGLARDGRAARAGGWGPLIGDEGSAYQIALGGLRLVARRRDGRAPSPVDDRLTASLCEAIGAEVPEALVTALYGPDWDRAQVAGLARLVVDAAEADVEIRETILQPASADLAAHIEAIIDRLFAGRLEGDDPPPLALAGSFLLGSSAIRAAVIGRLAGRVGPIGEVPEPARGALILARRALT